MAERTLVIAVVGAVLVGAPAGSQAQHKGQGAAANASASGAPQHVSGANVIMKLSPEAGFIDDVIAFGNQRVAYVVADTSTKAELRVVQLGCTKCVEAKQELVVDLSPVTLRPTAVRLVGQRAFVIGASEDGNQIGALVDLGKRTDSVIYKVGPAAHITVVQRDGQPRVAVHRTTPIKTGVRHVVELLALETGKRVAAGKPFELESAGDHHKKLDLRVNHWADGWTRAHGLKGGEWNKKENQRMPDTEATYDLVSGKFVDNRPIAEVVEQRKRYQTLADAGGQLDFLRMSWDNSAVQVWHRGQPRALELDQPLAHYDPKSLQGVVNSDGSAWIALKIDPVNPEAVARKKADPEFLDIFRVGPGEARAVRKARIPARNQRFRFGTLDGAHFWVLERSSGSDRGGRNVTIFQLPSP
jgi:hypothetical protein